MDEAKHYKFLNQDINKLVGVGSKIKNLLKKKKIEKISDLIWSFPHSFVDRSNLTNLDALKIGKVTTIKVKVIKYYFPRIRNLPNKVQEIILVDENNTANTMTHKEYKK